MNQWICHPTKRTRMVFGDNDHTIEKIVLSLMLLAVARSRNGYLIPPA